MLGSDEEHLDPSFLEINWLAKRRSRHFHTAPCQNGSSIETEIPPPPALAFFIFFHRSLINISFFLQTWMFLHIIWVMSADLFFHHFRVWSIVYTISCPDVSGLNVYACDVLFYSLLTRVFKSYSKQRQIELKTDKSTVKLIVQLICFCKSWAQLCPYEYDCFWQLSYLIFKGLLWPVTCSRPVKKNVHEHFGPIGSLSALQSLYFAIFTIYKLRTIDKWLKSAQGNILSMQPQFLETFFFFFLQLS